MTEIIVAIIGSGALSTLISLLVGRRNEKKDEARTVEDALQCLCLGEIRRSGEKHIARGQIAPDDYQEFVDLYDVYKRLGGNGYAERIKDAIDELPLTK